MQFSDHNLMLATLAVILLLTLVTGVGVIVLLAKMSDLYYHLTTMAQATTQTAKSARILAETKVHEPHI